MKSLFLIVLTLLLSACAINPHTEIWAPEIAGTITVNGKPLSGVTIVMARTDWLNPVKGCPDSYQEVISDKNGKFFLPADEHFSMFTVLGDTYFSWKVCAIINGSSITLWRGESIGIVTEESNAKVSCDIADSPIQTRKGDILCNRM